MLQGSTILLQPKWGSGMPTEEAWWPGTRSLMNETLRDVSADLRGCKVSLVQSHSAGTELKSVLKCPAGTARGSQLIRYSNSC